MHKLCKVHKNLIKMDCLSEGIGAFHEQLWIKINTQSMLDHTVNTYRV